MVRQQQKQQSFLDKVVERSGLPTNNDAQRASNVVFRILRDMMLNKTSDQIETELKERAPESEHEVVDLWQDYNVMVAFFSRISPAQNLHIKPKTGNAIDLLFLTGESVGMEVSPQPIPTYGFRTRSLPRL